jgi:hypothetical protein
VVSRLANIARRQRFSVVLNRLEAIGLFGEKLYVKVGLGSTRKLNFVTHRVGSGMFCLRQRSRMTSSALASTAQRQRLQDHPESFEACLLSPRKSAKIAKENKTIRRSGLLRRFQ